jgi:hypothetical protein
MSDFDAVVARANEAVRRGIATVELKETPKVLDMRDMDAQKGSPVVAASGEHAVHLVIEWSEMQP